MPGRRLAADHRPEHHQRRHRRRRRRRDHPVRGAAVRRRARRRRAAAAPAGRRLYDRDDAGALVRTDRVELDVVGSAPRSPGWSGKPRGALVLLNDDDLTYCKARLDPASLATAIDGIAEVTESLPQNPALVGGLGDDQGRPDAGQGLRHAGRPRDGHRGPDRCAAAGLGPAPGRGRLLRRTGVGGADRLAAGLRGAARPGGRPRRPAAIPSWPRCRRSPAPSWTRPSWPRSPAGGTVRRRCPA